MENGSLSVRSGRGDGGVSDTGDTNRTPKDHPVFAALGSIDELQASLGVAKAQCRVSGERPSSIVSILEEFQRQCFTLGGAVAAIHRGSPLGQTALDDAPRRLEAILTEYERLVPPMTDFALSGRDICSAEIDRSRTIARRCERDLVRFLTDTTETEPILRWINILSDVLFVLARYCEGPL